MFAIAYATSRQPLTALAAEGEREEARGGSGEGGSAGNEGAQARGRPRRASSRLRASSYSTQTRDTATPRVLSSPDPGITLAGMKVELWILISTMRPTSSSSRSQRIGRSGTTSVHLYPENADVAPSRHRPSQPGLHDQPSRRAGGSCRHSRACSGDVRGRAGPPAPRPRPPHEEHHLLVRARRTPQEGVPDTLGAYYAWRAGLPT